MGAALVIRGQRDGWYSPTAWAADEARLRAAGVDLETFSFDGGHEWNPDVSSAAAAFLQRFNS